MKYWQMFLNSKVAVTTVTLLFGLLTSYMVYDYASQTDTNDTQEEISIVPDTQPPIGRELIIQSIPCDNKEHIFNYHD